MGQITKNSKFSNILANKDFLLNPEDYLKELQAIEFSFPYSEINSANNSELKNLVLPIFREEFQKIYDNVTLGIKPTEEYTFFETLFYSFWGLSDSSNYQTIEDFAYILSESYHSIRFFFLVNPEYNLQDPSSEYWGMPRRVVEALKNYSQLLKRFFENERESIITDPFFIAVQERLTAIHPGLKSSFFNTDSIMFNVDCYEDCEVNDIYCDAKLSLFQEIIPEEILEKELIPHLHNIVYTLNKHVPTDLVFEGKTPFITMHFENFKVSNERGDETTVKSLYFFVPIEIKREVDFNNLIECRIKLGFSREIRGYVNNFNITDVRVNDRRKEFNESNLLIALMHKNYREYMDNLTENNINSMFGLMYSHSHLSSGVYNDRPNTFCIGTEDIYDALRAFSDVNLSSENSEEVENQLSYYYYLVNSYLQYESVDGVPYIYISQKQSLKNAMLTIASEEEEGTNKKKINYKTAKNSTAGKIKEHADLLKYLKFIKGKEINTSNALETFVDLFGEYSSVYVKNRLRRRLKVFTKSEFANGDVMELLTIARREISEVCIEIDFQRNTLNSLNYYTDILGTVTLFQTEKNVNIVKELFMNLFKLKHLIQASFLLMDNVQRWQRLKRNPPVILLEISKYFFANEHDRMIIDRMDRNLVGGIEFFYTNFKDIYSIYQEEDHFKYCVELLLDEKKQEENIKGMTRVLERYKEIVNRFFKGENMREVSMSHYENDLTHPGIKHFYFKGEKIKRFIYNNSSELIEELSPLISEDDVIQTSSLNISEFINNVKQVPPAFVEGFIKELENELSR